MSQSQISDGWIVLWLLRRRFFSFLKLWLTDVEQQCLWCQFQPASVFFDELCHKQAPPTTSDSSIQALAPSSDPDTAEAPAEEPPLGPDAGRGTRMTLKGTHLCLYLCLIWHFMILSVFHV